MTSKTIPPFLSKLYELCNEFTPDYECLVWSADGTHFWVSNIEIFSRDVLPGFYKHNNYASFVRQLNIYGFRRTSEHKPTHTPDAPIVEVFRHPMFIRGRRDLLQLIHRKSSVAAVASSQGVRCHLHIPSSVPLHLPRHSLTLLQRKIKLEADDDDTESISSSRVPALAVDSGLLAALTLKHD